MKCEICGLSIPSEVDGGIGNDCAHYGIMCDGCMIEHWEDSPSCEPDMDPEMRQSVMEKMMGVMLKQYPGTGKA